MLVKKEKIGGINMNILNITEDAIDTKLEMLRREQITADYAKGFVEAYYSVNVLNLTQYKGLLEEIDEIREENEYQEVKKEIENESLDC